MKLKILILVILGAFGASAWHWRDSARDWLDFYLGAETAEPVPTTILGRQDYRVVVPALGELTGLRITPVQAPQTRGGALRIAWIAAEGSIAEEGDLLVRFDNTDALISLEKNQNTVSTYDQRIEKTSQDAQTERQILKLDLDEAGLEVDFAGNQVRKDESIFSQWEIRESIISAALASYKQEKVETKGEIRKKVSTADLQILDIEKGKAQSEVSIAQETLSSLEVVAPVQGVVLYKQRGFNRLEAGSEVWPGWSILELAALYQFQSRLQLPETEVTGVVVGQEVELVLGSFPGQSFPGRVESIAKAPAQIQRKDPRKYFSCEVVLDVPLEIMKQLKPGMRVEGRIRISSHPSAYVIPKSALFKEEQATFVFIQQGQDFARRDVRILDSDHGFYLIEGVEEGERLALRHPFRQEKLHLPDFNAPTAPTQSRRFIIVG